VKLYLPTLENYVNFVDELPLLLLAEVVSSSNIDHLLEVSHAIESYGTFRTTRDRQITSTKEFSLLVSCKVIHPKYYKNLKKAAQHSHLGR
jgi:hypothetical protein